MRMLITCLLFLFVGVVSAGEEIKHSVGDAKMTAYLAKPIVGN